MKKLDPIKNKDILIGIDIALNTSGFCIMSPEGKVYYTQIIDMKKSLNYYEKLNGIYDKLINIFSTILEKNPRSVTLILEGRLKAGWSGSTLASIEGARVSSYHAFRQVFKASKIKNRFFVYEPGIIKKHFTGKRAAKKDIMLKSVGQKHPFVRRYKQEDILDAIYLVLYHIET